MRFARTLALLAVPFVAATFGCAAHVEPDWLMSTSSTTPVPSCDALYGHPFTVEQLNTGCMRYGTLTFFGAATMDCVDGRVLVWNDLGYGFDGRAPGAPAAADELFVHHDRSDGQLVPPDAVMDRCQAPKL